MLGRISLNPIRHIDPVGTLLLPAIGLVSGGAVFGWAKPTPVDPRNFPEPMRDDILTSIAGPISNFLVAGAATLILLLISVSSAVGHTTVITLARSGSFAVSSSGGDSILVPASIFFYEVIFINVLLAVFNLIPIPPLDGSHVLRHFLSDTARRAYDSIGIFALFALVFFGGRLLGQLISPFLNFFDWILLSL